MTGRERLLLVSWCKDSKEINEGSVPKTANRSQLAEMGFYPPVKNGPHRPPWAPDVLLAHCFVTQSEEETWQLIVWGTKKLQFWWLSAELKPFCEREGKPPVMWSHDHPMGGRDAGLSQQKVTLCYYPSIFYLFIIKIFRMLKIVCWCQHPPAGQECGVTHQSQMFEPPLTR